MKKFLFLIPILIFAEIIKYENLKQFYYKNEIVNFNIKIILSKPKKLIFLPSNNVEINSSLINPYIYKINISFKNDDTNHSLIIVGNSFYKEITLNSLFKTKNLPPLPNNFSKIVSDELNISNSIASLYKNKILLSFTIKCKNCNLKDFNLSSDESNLTLLSKNEATYYLTLPKNIKNFSFYYFNSNTQSFKKISIPIILKQEIISTQENISPKENIFFTPFNILLLAVSVFMIITYLIYKNFLILIIPLIIGSYLIYQLLPKGEVILNKNAKITILPTKQSTIIYVTKNYEKAKVLKKINHYTKIEIKNKIGWVKNEDIK